MLIYYADPDYYVNPVLSSEEIKEKKDKLISGLEKLRSEKEP
jgi:hypothetical protein